MRYKVYESSIDDPFVFLGDPITDGKPDVLLDTDSLGECCVLCYNLAMQYKGRRFVTWHDEIESIREDCCYL